jgi:hypothetical protein
MWRSMKHEMAFEVYLVKAMVMRLAFMGTAHRGRAKPASFGAF